MLCITLLPNEYLTVGSDIVIQYDRLSGERVHLAIHAPREIPIIRGEVLERQGGRRPDCVTDMAPRHVRQLPWNSQKKQALAELRQTLARMGDSPEARRETAPQACLAGSATKIVPRLDFGFTRVAAG